jgi:hypothetical protein
MEAIMGVGEISTGVWNGVSKATSLNSASLVVIEYQHIGAERNGAPNEINRLGNASHQR